MLVPAGVCRLRSRPREHRCVERDALLDRIDVDTVHGLAELIRRRDLMHRIRDQGSQVVGQPRRHGRGVVDDRVGAEERERVDVDRAGLRGLTVLRRDRDDLAGVVDVPVEQVVAAFDDEVGRELGRREGNAEALRGGARVHVGGDGRQDRKEPLLRLVGAVEEAVVDVRAQAVLRGEHRDQGVRSRHQLPAAAPATSDGPATFAAVVEAARPRCAQAGGRRGQEHQPEDCAWPCR